jgi:MFS family permease
LPAPAPGTRSYTKAIVAAQMLAQIGAFALPALLPGYIARWDLSKTEAGWLVGIFFAAYVVMVPVLVALTDRLPVRRVYMLGTGLTALSHFGFALFADGFWSALLLRMLAGIGWAGTYMPGLKAIADPLEGTAQSRASHGTRPALASQVRCRLPLPAWSAIGRELRPHFSSAARPR